MDSESDTAAESTFVVTQDEGMWIIRVNTNGKVQEYRCVSEVQARTLAVLLGSPAPEAAKASH